MRTTLLIVLAAGVLLPAQTRRTRKPAGEPVAAQAAQADSWPIASIAIQGIHQYTPEQVLAVAGVRVGQVVTKPLLEAAHARLMGSGGFESVAYRFEPAAKANGIALTYELVEVNAFYPILFEDLPATEAELTAYLKSKDPLFGPRISATKEALEHYKTLVAQYLTTKGFEEPLIARLSSERPPELVVLLRPATQRPNIAQVKVTNSGEISAGVAQSTLYGVAVGTTYSEPRVRQLLDSSIRPLYEAKGHLRVEFPEIAAQPAKDVKGVAVTVRVEQGPVFNFGKVGFAGAPTPVDELQPLVKIKPGTLADFDQVRAAQSKLVNFYRHDGYLQAKVDAVRSVHDAEKTVDLTFTIELGPQFLFRQLTIVGLDLESEPVIRKLWGLKQGAPFNPDYPEHFLERVKEMGVFDYLKDAAAERKVNPDDHTVDVTLTFKGGAAPPDSERKPRLQ